MVGENKRRYIYIVTTCLFQDSDFLTQDAVHSELFTNETKAKQYMITLLASLFPFSCLQVNPEKSLVDLLNDTSSQPDIIQTQELEPHHLVKDAIMFDTDIIRFDYEDTSCIPITKGFIKLQTSLINERLENKRKVQASCSRQA